ncbi:hypothetical protein OAL66_01810 [bacterium]|nr:hypothetical protein [bacterium]
MSDYSGRLFKPNQAQREMIATRKAIAAENAAIEKQKQSDELWSWYLSQDTNESFEAQAEARESLRVQKLRDQIAMEVVITDIPEAP